MHLFQLFVAAVCVLFLFEFNVIGYHDKMTTIFTALLGFLDFPW
mgnify:CR=1 FL=1